ncbi:DUF6186 family protein [Micromonospora sp. NPDC050417]|uniref:DUF6186 family protein n=1 Tax=Micromonospora sp. NPDC050417 TaxID=3364280 RepID=UPI00378948CE
MTARNTLIAGFAVIFAVMFLVDLAGRRPDSTVAPLGNALIAAMRTGTGRLIVLGTWLWMGWHFLAR